MNIDVRNGLHIFAEEVVIEEENVGKVFICSNARFTKGIISSKDKALHYESCTAIIRACTHLRPVRRPKLASIRLYQCCQVTATNVPETSP